MIIKAGLLPYQVREDGVHFLFMRSSNADFGGALPQVCKGEVDQSDANPLAAALREAQEELGVTKQHMKLGTLSHLWTGYLTTPSMTCEATFFMVELDDPVTLLKPHYETESVHWMTLEKFLEEGRDVNFDLVKLAASRLVKR